MLLHKHYYNTTELMYNMETNGNVTVPDCSFTSIRLYDYTNDTENITASSNFFKNTTKFYLKVCGGQSAFVVYLPTYHIMLYSANQIQRPKISFKFSYTIIEVLKYLSERITVNHYMYYPSEKYDLIIKGIDRTDSKLDNHVFQLYVQTLMDQYIKIDVFEDIQRNNSRCVGYIPYKIMDGPLKIFEREMCMPGLADTVEGPPNSQPYNGSFKLYVLYHMLNPVKPYGTKLLMDYIVKKLPSNTINMTSYSNNQTVSFVISNENILSYYKRWRIFAVSPIEIEFVQINKFEGFYSNCIYGGFVLREAWIDINENATEEDLTETRSLYGPYCTQFGGEPLVNAIKRFQMKNNTASITAYGYSDYFEIDITVRVTTNNCLV